MGKLCYVGIRTDVEVDLADKEGCSEHSRGKNEFMACYSVIAYLYGVLMCWAFC